MATYQFGAPIIVHPTETHKATIVWLHGLGEKGSEIRSMLMSYHHIPHANVKWIFPTAPIRHVSQVGRSYTAWCEPITLSDDMRHDAEELDASAAHIASLLSAEPTFVKIGIAGFSQGAALSLYTAICFAVGKYNNGAPFPVNITAVIGASGYLPCSRSLKNKIEGSSEASRRAGSLPILLCHKTHDELVPCKYGDEADLYLRSAGFQNILYKKYEGFEHFIHPVDEMTEILSWFISKLV